jgi:hypothetical protein
MQYVLYKILIFKYELLFYRREKKLEYCINVQCDVHCVPPTLLLNQPTDITKFSIINMPLEATWAS